MGFGGGGVMAVMRDSDRPFACHPYPLRTADIARPTTSEAKRTTANAPTYSKPLPQLRPLYNDIAKTQ